MARAYKVRKFQNGRGRDGTPFYNYALTIPTEIARALPVEIQYECVPTEEGLLFKPVDPEGEKVEMPSWAQRNGGKAKAPPKPRKRPGAKAASK